MASTTTLWFPDTYTPYIQFALGPPVAVTLTEPELGYNSYASGFTVYLPQEIDSEGPVDASEAKQIVQQLYGGADPANILAQHLEPSPTASYVAFTTGRVSKGTLLVPIVSTLDPTVSLTTVSNALDAIYRNVVGITSPPQASQTPASAGVSASVTPSQTSASADTIAIVPGGTSNPSSTGGGPVPSTTKPSGVDQKTFSGAVAGGVIGGLLAGAAVGFLIFTCCFRGRPSRRSLSSEEVYEETRHKPMSVEDKTPRALERSMSVAGWQKHLPQEKGDRVIGTTIQTLFEHIQMHVDGYYGDRRGPASSAAVATLASVSEDGLHERAAAAQDIKPLLQAILTRRIVHRISLRSAAAASLLPAEYTSIPESRQWHVEREGGDKGALLSSKRGLPQAFSEWRMLTAFIRSDPHTDAEHGRALTAKINHAVHALSAAFAPWQLPDKSSSDRFRSLQSILEEASRAGVLLFRQRSLYVFDWTRGPDGEAHAFVVTPALIKELDEYGESVRPAEVLVQAT